MRIHLFSFGKLKTAGLQDAVSYYEKIARPWLQISLNELRPISIPEKKSEIRLQIQRKESLLLQDRIQSETSSKVPIFLLDEKGKNYSTQEWANHFRTLEGNGFSAISICIGSSLGFSDDFRNQARGLISLGKQTLSHELARVILYEQLYRAYSVIKGHPYHNEGP